LAGGDADRHERPVARNMKAKQDDEDDAPTYVLEETNQSMTKEEYEAFISEKEPEEVAEAKTGEGEPTQTKDGETKSKDKITEVGANAKKRKAAKIISDEPNDGKDAPKADTKTVKKAKKKAKAVKLTFGDEEEG
jgi:hypothetical protein